MANCYKYVSLYTEYLDGGLAASLRSEFEDHVRTCSECADSLRQMRTLKGHLKQLSPVKTSDTFYVVLRSKIRQELERETLPEKVLNFFRIYRWPSFATGLAALILVIFISYSDIFQPKTTSPISSQLTESGQLISAKPKHVVTPPPGVFLVVEETDKENLFDRGEKLNSETLSSKRQDLTVYYDSTRIYQPRPVGVYLTTPKPSAAF